MSFILCNDDASTKRGTFQLSGKGIWKRKGKYYSYTVEKNGLNGIMRQWRCCVQIILANEQSDYLWTLGFEYFFAFVHNVGAERTLSVFFCR